MKANKANLLYFLSSSKYFEVPISQGCYSWDVENCQSLWDDIINLCENKNTNSHFLGIFLHLEKANKKFKISQLFDGWQRLISVSLILAAIRETITEDEDDEDLSYKKLHKFLFLKDEDAYKPKIILCPYDKPTYDTIVTGGDINDNNASENLVKNYEFFKTQVENSNWSLKKIFNSLLKFEIIDISIEEDADNIQSVFESIYSARKPLSELDYIKNEVMMGINRESQVEMYYKYWLLLEESFEKYASIDVLENFLASYLTIQNQGKIINKNNLYQEFSKFYSRMLKIQDRFDIMENILKYANYYLKLYSLKINSTKVKRHIKKINQTAGDKAYPFLMEVMDDLENGLINEDLLAEILKTTLNLIKESDDNNFSFNDLSGNINKMLALKDFIPKIVVDKTHEPLIKPKGPETINDIIKATGS